MSKTIYNIHKGHRKRLRQRFLKEGLDTFEEHNVLELLLFFGIPYKDTNDTAHELIDKFGSIDEVFEADFTELQKVNGMGECSATLIKLIPQLSKYYLSLKTREKVNFDSINDIAEFMRSKHLFETREIFTALYLDASNKLISYDVIAEGTANHVDINIPKLIEISVSKNASSVIVSHNHPSGSLIASTADLHATSHMSDAFKMLHIKFVDHIIVTNTDYVSLAKISEYSRYFK